MEVARQCTRNTLQHVVSMAIDKSVQPPTIPDRTRLPQNRPEHASEAVDNRMSDDYDPFLKLDDALLALQQSLQEVAQLEANGTQRDSCVFQPQPDLAP